MDIILCLKITANFIRHDKGHRGSLWIYRYWGINSHSGTPAVYFEITQQERAEEGKTGNGNKISNYGKILVIFIQIIVL